MFFTKKTQYLVDGNPFLKKALKSCNNYDKNKAYLIQNLIWLYDPEVLYEHSSIAEENLRSRAENDCKDIRWGIPKDFAVTISPENLTYRFITMFLRFYVGFSLTNNNDFLKAMTELGRRYFGSYPYEIKKDDTASSDELNPITKIDVLTLWDVKEPLDLSNETASVFLRYIRNLYISLGATCLSSMIENGYVEGCPADFTDEYLEYLKNRIDKWDDYKDYNNVSIPPQLFFTEREQVKELLVNTSENFMKSEKNGTYHKGWEPVLRIIVMYHYMCNQKQFPEFWYMRGCDIRHVSVFSLDKAIESFCLEHGYPICSWEDSPLKELYFSFPLKEHDENNPISEATLRYIEEYDNVYIELFKIYNADSLNIDLRDSDYNLVTLLTHMVNINHKELVFLKDQLSSMYSHLSYDLKYSATVNLFKYLGKYFILKNDTSESGKLAQQIYYNDIRANGFQCFIDTYVNLLKSDSIKRFDTVCTDLIKTEDDFISNLLAKITISISNTSKFVNKGLYQQLSNSKDDAYKKLIPLNENNEIAFEIVDFCPTIELLASYYKEYQEEVERIISNDPVVKFFIEQFNIDFAKGFIEADALLGIKILCDNRSDIVSMQRNRRLALQEFAEIKNEERTIPYNDTIVSLAINEGIDMNDYIEYYASKKEPCALRRKSVMAIQQNDFDSAWEYAEEASNAGDEAAREAIQKAVERDAILKSLGITRDITKVRYDTSKYKD